MSDETETKRMGDSTLRNLLASSLLPARSDADAGGQMEMPGDFIRRYKLLGKIGVGGFQEALRVWFDGELAMSLPVGEVAAG